MTRWHILPAAWEPRSVRCLQDMAAPIVSPPWPQRSPCSAWGCSARPGSGSSPVPLPVAPVTLPVVLSAAPRVLLPGSVSAALAQPVSDELLKLPHAPGGRRGKQLQEKEQIPLFHLMIFICVSVGAGALFSKMQCSRVRDCLAVTSVLARALRGLWLVNLSATSRHGLEN